MVIHVCNTCGVHVCVVYFPTFVYLFVYTGLNLKMIKMTFCLSMIKVDVYVYNVFISTF